MLLKLDTSIDESSRPVTIIYLRYFILTAQTQLRFW